MRIHESQLASMQVSFIKKKYGIHCMKITPFSTLKRKKEKFI